MNRKVEIKTIDGITLKGTINSKRIEDDDTITYGLLWDNKGEINQIEVNENEIFILAYV